MTVQKDVSLSTLSYQMRRKGLFSDWTATEMNELINLCELTFYTPRQVIIQRGQICTSFYFIEQGTVRYELQAPNGKTKLIKEAKAGDLVGEAFVLMGSVCPMHIVAAEHTQLLRIDKGTYYQKLAKQPHLMMALISLLSKRLYYILGDVESSLSLSGTQRVIFYLLDGVALRDETTITLDRPKAQIAMSLNLTPEHFSRILNDLSAKGFVEVQGRKLTIKDIEGLCLYER